MSRILTLLCLSAVWLQPLPAQTISTEVLGTVTDSTGAVVPSAQVTLLRLATGERRQTVTDSAGNYSFPLIEIGDYSITVSMAGFKTYTQTGINVSYQQKARVNITLEVGAATERVEVQATSVELKTDDAAVSTTIERRRVQELPLLGRNFASLAILTPGVQYGTRMGQSISSNTGFPFPGAATTLSANGQRDANQNITMDGVVATEPLVNQVLFNPSIDAIEEVKIQTGTVSAEYGQNNGAVVQIALKSGTNEFHGTFFDFIRNNILDARDYFLNFELPPGVPERKKNALRRHQFGAWLAGPVKLPRYNGKDRTFWSFNYEGVRQTVESVQQAFWFPEEFRRGDFSALLRPVIRNGVPIRPPIIIFDPMTGEPFRGPDGQINNIIPPNRINRNAQNFINTYLPLPQFRPEDILDVNVIASVPSFLDQNQYFARIDHNFNSNDRVFVRYAGQRTSFRNPALNPNFGTNYSLRPNNVASQWLHMFRPTVLNEFRFGYNRVDHDQSNPRTNTNFDVDSLGIGQFRVAVDNNRKFRPLEAAIPPTGIIQGDSGARIDFNDTFQISDNFSIIRSKHHYKMGMEYRRLTIERAAANVPYGSLSCCPGGYPLAGWLMGYPNGSTTAEGLLLQKPRQHRWSAYFLDEWKATRRLTINAGVRWDYFGLATDVNRTWRSLRLDILTRSSDGQLLPTVVPEPGKPYRFYDPEERFFMPRLGIAFRATEKWVIRTGAGWYANAQQLNNFSILNLQPPLSGTFGFNQVTDVAQVIPYSYAGQVYNIQTRRFRPGTTILTLDNPFPGQGTAAARTNVLAMIPDNRASNYIQWSFDIQRQLPFSAVLTVGYVGSKTSHLDNTVSNFNCPDPSPDTDFNRRRPYQAYISAGEGNQPRLLNNIRYLDSYANANYHALQVQLQKRYSHGFTFGLAYTYGKALGEGYGRNDPAGDVQAIYQNPRDRRSDRTRYGFDITHNAITNFVYDLPFFKGSTGFTKAVFGGWQASGIITLRTGFPFTLSGGNLNTDISSTRPDRIADGRLGKAATRKLWYDPTAFRRTDCNIPGRLDLCKYGNAGNGILVSPGTRSLDLSVGKNWRIPQLGEQGRLQFRGEAFNAFNTPQFGTPNGLSYLGLDSVVPDGPRVGEIRTLRNPMRIFQVAVKLYF
ncbi:MAG: TonB-dependent receptor [Bryobacteraceae bacterium]|nr:TonB-dependent receptor [Bryobacteraceae bacterium]MDW8378495.1 TonB-dependent receptor [Bryobacterales bacterium]